MPGTFEFDTLEIPVVDGGDDATPLSSPSKPMLWTGRVLTAPSALFLLMDGVLKLIARRRSSRPPRAWAIPPAWS